MPIDNDMVSEIATAGWLPGSDWTGTPIRAHLHEGGAR